jgi:hypothetical protein
VVIVWGAPPGNEEPPETIPPWGVPRGSPLPLCDRFHDVFYHRLQFSQDVRLHVLEVP